MYRVQVYDEMGNWVGPGDSRLSAKGMSTKHLVDSKQPKAVELLVVFGKELHRHPEFVKWQVELVKQVIHPHSPKEIVEHDQSVPSIRPTQSRYGSVQE